MVIPSWDFQHLCASMLVHGQDMLFDHPNHQLLSALCLSLNHMLLVLSCFPKTIYPTPVAR